MKRSIQNFYYYAKLYLKSFLSWKMLGSVLSSFGSLWILISILDYYSSPAISSLLKTHWALFLVAGCVLGGFLGRPCLSCRCSLKDRDIHIEIKVADLFRQKGSWIINTNTTFDTETPSLIKPETVQGQLTTRFYSDWRVLDNQVSEELKNRCPSEELNDGRHGKSTRYPFGETISIRPTKDQIAYLVAIADMNEHGNASGSLDSLRQALAGLWDFIRTRGDQGDLVVPVLGTGPTRLKQNREQIVTEIVRSFIAASTEATFCPKLTVVIYPSDASKYKIDLRNLRNFLEVICNFNSIVSSGIHNRALGQGVS